jgi:hypothetical protein
VLFKVRSKVAQYDKLDFVRFHGMHAQEDACWHTYGALSFVGVPMPTM